MPKGKVVEYKHHKCVIGIDQSYKRTGISICVDGKLKKIKSITLKKGIKSQKRRAIQKGLQSALQACCDKYGSDNVVVIFERIRTFTESSIMNPSYLKAVGGLCATIIDTAYDYGVESWSVDTRAWKNGILGTSKPLVEPMRGVKDPKKIREVKYIISLGFEQEISVYKGHGTQFQSYDDDAADSACIALYGFVKKPLLKREW